MHACVVATIAELGPARVLVRSFRAHHPSAGVTLVVADDRDGTVAAAEPVVEGLDVVAPDALGLAAGDLEDLAMMYPPDGLRAALKPAALRSSLAGADGPVVSLDPSMRVLGTLDTLTDAARGPGLAVLPRAPVPVPDDGHEPDETAALQLGTFASELLAVSEGARPFLDWWYQRCRRHCVWEPANQVARERRWLDLVAGRFPHTVVDDELLGSAWTLHERDVSAVAAISLSGFDSHQPWLLDATATRSPRILVSEHAALRALLADHAAEVRAESTPAPGAGWSTLDDGTPVDDRMRHTYRAALLAADRAEADAPPRPFGPGTAPDFLAWLATAAPGAEHPGVSRYLAQIWAERPDLRLVFPRLAGPTADRFLEWCASHGRTEAAIPDALVPETRVPAADEDDVGADEAGAAGAGIDQPGTDGAGARETRADGARAREARSGQADADGPPAGRPGADATGATTTDANAETATSTGLEAGADRDRIGVNVVGYHRAVLGLGQAGRLVTAALDEAGIPHALVTSGDTMSAQTHDVDDVAPDAAPHDVNLLFVTADRTPNVVEELGTDLLEDRYTIGFWFWETDVLTPPMHEALELVDELWVASRYGAELYAPHTDVPITEIPLPVTEPAVPGNRDRASFGLPEDRFVILFSFDLLSTIERKNPLGLLEAYRRAFGPDDGAMLVLKSINGPKRMSDLERLRVAAAGRADVVVWDEYLSADDRVDLLAVADCFASLHRSEGFGFGLAESMAVGKPVIGTAYSGNLSFMSEENSYLVRAGLTEVGPASPPYPPAGRWADPDLDHAAELLRHVHDHRDEALAVGRRAAADIAREHSVERVAETVSARLDAIAAHRAAERAEQERLAREQERQAARDRSLLGRARNRLRR